MARRPSSLPLTTLITLTGRIARKYTRCNQCNPCNLCPPILIRVICVHLCNPCYWGSRRVGRHDGTHRRDGDHPMDTTTPKRAFASPTIDNHPLGDITYSLGRFSPLKTHFPQYFPLEEICIIAWDGFRRLKRISRNISRSRVFASWSWGGFRRLKRISRNISRSRVFAS